MTCTNRALGAAAGLVAGLALATTALAQSTHSVSRVESVSESVTVQSVDLATRHLVVKRPSGELESLKVPPEVTNFKQLKPGDAINAHYYRETELALVPPGKAPPKDSAAVISARAPEGSMPAGAAASHIVVTGAILGIDHQKHRLKVVNPKGGEVHEFTVEDPQGQKLMSKLKVGDKVTAYITEGVLIEAKRG